uniref:Dehydrogenase/reductase SDR family member 2, mitochondrial-like n=1 Tax=Ursus maritimus TaxID=29073 RepID=A0A452UK35_URSMA
MASVIGEIDFFSKSGGRGKRPPAGMFQAVAWVRRGLFHFRAGLSVRMNSTAIDRKGVLANRVAVITGSTEGIGFAIARRLAQDGAHVVISSRKQQNVDRAVAALQGEGLSVTGTVCHVGKAEDRERLVATLGPYNISKTAILGLTRTLSLELAPKGIRVNCLAALSCGSRLRSLGAGGLGDHLRLGDKV